MQVAIFSDVHGNLTALEAVLADIEQQEVDVIVFAGDLCLAGPRPATCLERIQAAEIVAIYGNTDDWVLGRQQPPEHLAALSVWTQQQLSDTQRDWLASLPFAHHITPTAKPQDSLLIVHANPKDVNAPIFAQESVQIKHYGRILQPDNELAPLFVDVTAQTIAFGHIHIPNLRIYNEYQLANISSVSMPGDGDIRAKYGLFTWQNSQWHLTHHYVPYSIAAEVEAIRIAQPPGWQQVVSIMQTEGTYPQKITK